MQPCLRAALFFLALGASAQSFAGVFEIGAQANYRSTNFDSANSDAMESGTGSLGYYFWDLSALEINYTRGDAKQVTTAYTSYQDITAYGLDLMIVIANKESSLKPYIKLGGVYVDKSLKELFGDLPTVSIETKGVAPSVGLGFKLMITQQFALKFGMDATSSPLFFYSSTSPNPNTTTYDFSANGGLSILF